jgi:iron complex transport system substrate-binding protein
MKYSFLIILFLIAISCKSNLKRYEKKADLGIDVKYAERFDIQQKNGYKILIIKNPWQGAVNISQSYYLVKVGAIIPPGVDSANIIRTPVKSIICMSTTYLSMISVLHAEETIAGVSGSDFVYDPVLIRRIDNKQIADVGYENNLNKELVIQLSPDLVMVYGVGSESAGYLNKLKELGIKVVFNADYLENNPLGKAEWIKVFGALYDKENEADSIFNSVSDQYNEIKLLVEKNIKVKPSVLLGLPWKDTWFISPGNSFISKLISDAGGEYLWKDTESEISMPYGIENVFIRAINADCWLNAGSANSRNEIVGIDNRLRELRSFKSGNIFNNNNRVTKKGGNDYWESGNMNPQIVLKDIASVLHPDLFPGYNLFYYRKLE